MVLVVVPLDEIKIDKAFVLGLGADADPADVAIVQAVIAMARPLPSEALEQWAGTASWGGAQTRCGGSRIGTGDPSLSSG